MVESVYELINKTAPITSLPNSNAKSLTVQKTYVYIELSCSSNTFRRGDWSSHKNHMGEDQNKLTYDGQFSDSVGIAWVHYLAKYNQFYLHYHHYSNHHYVHVSYQYLQVLSFD